MGRSGMISKILLTALLLNATILVSCQSSSSLESTIDEQINDARDSRLKHVQLRQETGFDGKVRSIRFRIDPEEMDNKQEELVKNKEIIDMTSAVSETMESTTADFQEAPKIIADIAPSVSLNNLRNRRSIDKSATKNDLHDLEGAEAKVFRPLFVHRNQVARRLKLKNAKAAGVRPKPSSHRYHTYRYAPGGYYSSG